MTQETIDRIQEPLDQYTIAKIKRENLSGFTIGNIEARRNLCNLMATLQEEIMQILFDSNKEKVEQFLKSKT